MNCKTIAVGGVLFVIEHRGDDDDYGASLSLLVEVEPEEHKVPRLVTIWRADCIMRDPHEHWFGSEEEYSQHTEMFVRSPVPIKGLTMMEPATFSGSVEPFMERILHVREIIEKTGYTLRTAIDQEAINATAGSIQRWMTLAQDPEAFREALLQLQASA